MHIHNGSGTHEMTSIIRFPGAANIIGDGSTKAVLFTWNGRTDGAGVPVDCHLYINGVQCSENHSFYNGTAKARGLSNLYSPTQVTIANRYDGSPDRKLRQDLSLIHI